MDRFDAFESLSRDPWYAKYKKKLTQQENILCYEFLVDNKDCDNNQFCHKVNRMFLDKGNPPKNWTLIMELLTVSAGKSQPGGR
jgi:hypothetical protein